MIQKSYSEVYTPKNWKQELRYLYAGVHSSILQKSQKVEATHVSSTDQWINEREWVLTLAAICSNIMLN